MIISTILFALVVVFVDFVYNRTNRRRRLINKIPGPPCLPIIGNTLIGLVPTERIWNVNDYIMRTYGPTVKVRAGNIVMVGISDPDDVEILLSSRQHTEKGFVYNHLHPWLKTGLKTSHGEKWKQRRKILTSAFHINILKKYTEITSERGEKVVQLLGNEKGDESIQSLVPLCSNCALDIICEAAMGIDLAAIEKGEYERYKEAVSTMGKISIYRIARPYINDWVMNCLWKLKKLQNETLNTLHGFANKVLLERREYHRQTDNKYLKPINDNDDESDDFVYGGRQKRLAVLDLLLSAEMNGLIDDEGIREEVDTFMFAGHDTTAMAMTFTLMLLANHATIQDEVRAEVSEIIDRTDGQLGINEIQEFSYLERCIKESLRLYPPAYTASRTIRKDLQLKTCIVPANTDLFFQVYYIHRNPKHWSEPEKFDPDRFLPERMQGRHPFSYIPFSAGPRHCIGQKFAMLELKSLIARILYNFKLEPIDPISDMELTSDLLIRPRNPVRVKFTKIR